MCQVEFELAAEGSCERSGEAAHLRLLQTGHPGRLRHPRPSGLRRESQGQVGGLEREQRGAQDGRHEELRGQSGGAEEEGSGGHGAPTKGCPRWTP
uniref:Uncharacterized protein n=1 Tax=Colobus angolensis palliatus TaxID=336983 RepID=A0A2K5JU58_COLAP